MNFRYRLMQFMQGRYGFDKLGYFIFGLAAVLAFINTIFRSIIIQLIVYAVFIYGVFRVLSRNTFSRAKENKWFEKKLFFLKSKKELYEKKKNDPFHVYKKCPGCKAVLRLPNRPGTHTTVCPRCNTEFKVKVKN